MLYNRYRITSVIKVETDIIVVLLNKMKKPTIINPYHAELYTQGDQIPGTNHHMTVSALGTTTLKPSYDRTRMGRVKYLNVSITALVRYTHGKKNGQPNNNFESLWEQLRIGLKQDSQIRL
jgi:hypothetical protein